MFDAHADWRILFAAARVAVQQGVHRDKAAVRAAHAAMEAGVRAGFCLRHAARAVTVALDWPAPYPPWGPAAERRHQHQLAAERRRAYDFERWLEAIAPEMPPEALPAE